MSSERFHLGSVEILVGADAAETMRLAAEQFESITRSLAEKNRQIFVALSGGNTPKALFSLLASNPFAGRIPWPAIHFFWADERNVPPTHPESNYAMAQELLLSRVPVPRSNIHRIPIGDGTAIEAADLYQRTVRECVPLHAGMPRFDYVLLGLGENMHTASLFPHRPTLKERQRLVVADHVDEVGSWRVTLTAPVINHAARIAFLVAGEAKAEAVQRVLQGTRDVAAVPAQLIAPSQGRLSWILDRAAARLLLRPMAPQGERNATLES